jgi:hypothetical protein
MEKGSEQSEMSQDEGARSKVQHFGPSQMNYTIEYGQIRKLIDECAKVVTGLWKLPTISPTSHSAKNRRPKHPLLFLLTCLPTHFHFPLKLYNVPKILSKTK